MIFNDNQGSEHRIQEVTLERVREYKYIGVGINNGAEYLTEHEKYVTAKGSRNAAVMKNRALWNYNNYEVVRSIWKGVVVTSLTFGNAVLCMRSEVRARLEVKQRGVGRLALGAHGNTPNQGVQGDMAWTSFEGREASSKIEFEERLREMAEKRWARRVFSYLYMRNVDTKWRKLTRKLSIKYFDCRRGANQETAVKKKVKETERGLWKTWRQTKSALRTYRTFKQEIAKENIYDNSRGSSLLFEARTGVLRTKMYRVKYQGIDTLCSPCGEEEETAEHLKRFCNGNGADFFKALGFRDSEGKIDFKRVEITKQRLSAKIKARVKFHPPQTTLTLGDHRLSRVSLGARGTPQGAVPSPILFNIALLQLPNQLSQVSHIHFSFYADDITVWANRGSDADMEHNLLSALNITESYVHAHGLAFSPSKSELFLYRPRPHDPVSRSISLMLGNHPIPLVSNIRILGLVLHSHGARCDTTQALRTQTQQATRLIRRVAHLHAGLRERNTCRLTQAYITSRTAYAFPYLPLKQKERDHIHALLRSCTKVALCLSPSTSTARLLNLGAHNRLEELEQATLRAQLTRLSGFLGNEEVHSLARGLAFRAGVGPPPPAL
ncbi:uncharacterized protein LOC125945030 [Dermacentor silvarum]|uniref:uncharacterized protein LOC125945030 n=1 Tax=Dermacentor silvarum TaxID=543639 RepID=UPI002100B253|nr:uncharacterized protein LOC125945030 [Dermacentor silvarum]